VGVGGIGNDPGFQTSQRTLPASSDPGDLMTAVQLVARGIEKDDDSRPHVGRDGWEVEFVDLQHGTRAETVGKCRDDSGLHIGAGGVVRRVLAQRSRDEVSRRRLAIGPRHEHARAIAREKGDRAGLRADDGKAAGMHPIAATTAQPSHRARS
jgi:hypothetical protein